MRRAALVVTGFGSYVYDAGLAIQQAGDKIMQLGMALYEGERLHPMFSSNGDLDEPIFNGKSQITRSSLPDSPA